MKWLLKLFKWIAGTLVTLVLLVTLLLAIFKQDIIDYAIKEINKHLAVKVHVASIDLRFWSTFPNVSLDFNDVFVSDSYPKATLQDTLLYSDKIRLRFNALDIWNKKYKVESIALSPGTIQIKENEAGVGNYFVLKDQDSTDSSSEFKLDLQSVSFDNVRFSYSSKLSDVALHVLLEETKVKGKFNNEVTTLSSSFKGQISSIKQGQVELLTAKQAAFDASISVNQLSGEFELQPTTLFIEDLPFQLHAIMDSSKYAFSVNANNLKVEEVLKKVYAQEDAKNMKSTGTLYFDLDLTGKSGVSAPNVQCDFGIKNGSVTEPSQNLRISSLEATGSYHSDESKGKEDLSISSFSCVTKHGPFSGNVRIREFHKPHVTGAVSGTLDLYSISRFLVFDNLAEISGKLAAKSSYDLYVVPGNVGNTIDLKSLKGQLSCDGLAFQLKNDSRKFSHISGSFLVANDNAAIEYLHARINESDFKLNGEFSNLIPYLKKKDKLVASVSLDAAKIRTSDLIT